MVASVPKTKFEELYDELTSIARARRQLTQDRLKFLERRADTEIKKGNVETGDSIVLKAKLASLAGNAAALKSLSNGLCSFFGVEGRLEQFNNFVMIGYLSDGYELIREIQVQGQEFSKATWFCVAHALAGEYEKVFEFYGYIKRAYPKESLSNSVAAEMVNTAKKLADFLSTLEVRVNFGWAIQAAISHAVPQSMLSAPGVEYKSSSVGYCLDSELLMDLVVSPNDETADQLAEISKCFSRKLSELLPECVTDHISICLSFRDDVADD